MEGVERGREGGAGRKELRRREGGRWVRKEETGEIIRQGGEVLMHAHDTSPPFHDNMFLDFFFFFFFFLSRTF